jgi:hypothetical protein
LTAIEPATADADPKELWARMIQEAELAPDATGESADLWTRYRAAAGATTHG